ncbi:MAG: MFS transporter [Limnochordales bacterium]|nr:MFS transporter [Limnochordales bacterium]
MAEDAAAKRAEADERSGEAEIGAKARGNAERPWAVLTFLRTYPAFTWLWVGQMVSRLGDSIDAIAFVWLVLELTGSTLLMGTLLVVNMLPSILLNPVAGVWIDRLPRRPVIVISDAARAVTTGLVAALYLAGLLEVWHLYVVTTLNSIFEAFAVPARVAVIAQVVSGEDLVSANSLTSLSSSLASLFGLLLAAPLFKLLGIAGAIGLDAATFLFAALTALTASIPEIPTVSAGQEGGRTTLTGALTSFWSDLREGMHLVITQRVILYLIILAGLANFAFGPLEVLMPVYVREVLKMDVGQLSQVYLAFSLGALASGLLTMRVARKWPEAVLVLVGLGLMGTGYAFLYFARSFLVTLGLITLMGIGQAPAQAGLRTAVQRRTPPAVLGRVAGLLGTFSLSATPLSLALTGAVAEAVAAPVIFGAFGLLVLVLTVLILSRPVFGLFQTCKPGAILWKKSSG